MRTLPVEPDCEYQFASLGIVPIHSAHSKNPEIRTHPILQTAIDPTPNGQTPTTLAAAQIQGGSPLAMA